jgi:parvulin-like peptidyl-prolyl isomerase
MKWIVTFALSCCMAASVAAQDKAHGEVARIGESVIDADEFRFRYEAAVWLGKEQRARLQPSKHAFLLSLIAERLLAEEGLRRGLEQDSLIRPILNEIRRMLVLDALYHRRIRQPAEPGEADLMAFLPLYNTEVSFSYLIADTQTEALTYAAKLAEGASLDLLQSELGQSEHNRRMRWGDFYGPIEDALFGELTPGESSSPIEVDGAWYIVRLDDRHERVMLSAAEHDSAREELRRLLRGRNEQERFRVFMDEVGRNVEVAVDEHLFHEVAFETNRLLEARRALRLARDAERVFPLPFMEADHAGLRRALRRRLADPFVEGDASMTLNHVLERLYFKDLVLRSAGQRVEIALKSLLWEIIAEELLLQEGQNQRLHQLSVVDQDMETWTRAYLARGMRRVVMDSVRARHADAVTEIMVREVAVPTFEQAASILERLKSGESFGEIARLHSTRRESAENSGETGFVLAPLYHEAAGSLPIGEAFGPLPADDGYLIVEVRDRRRVPDEAAAREHVAEAMLNRYVASLAQRRGVSIDLDALEAIEVLPLNVLHVRFLGFNNRLLAAPTLQMVIEWFDHVDREMLYPEL